MAEKSQTLKAEALVADLTGRRHGVVKLGLSGSRFRVLWADGETTAEKRADLLTRYTTTTPVPAKKKPRFTESAPTPVVDEDEL